MVLNEHFIDIDCDKSIVCDISKAIVHSIIFFRSCGKFTYKEESSYSIKTLDHIVSDCFYLDFSYVRCSSEALTNKIDKRIDQFVSLVNERSNLAILRLEFYTKKPNRWPFNERKTAWEVWNIRLSFGMSQSNGNFRRNSLNHRLNLRASSADVKIEDILSEKLIEIASKVNREKESMPSMPTLANYENIFDPSFSDAQPYLFDIHWQIKESVEKQSIENLFTDSKSLNNSPSNSPGDTPRRGSLHKFIRDTLEL